MTRLARADLKAAFTTTMHRKASYKVSKASMAEDHISQEQEYEAAVSIDFLKPLTGPGVIFSTDI